MSASTSTLFSVDDSDDSGSDTTTIGHSSMHNPARPSSPSSTTPRYSDDDPPSPPPSSSPPHPSPSLPSRQSYYPPVPLASTMKSREAEFELDPDELDASDSPDASEPLLMEGLLQSGARRGSLDLRRREMDEEEEGGDVPDWLTRGAGVMAGIANSTSPPPPLSLSWG